MNARLELGITAIGALPFGAALLYGASAAATDPRLGGIVNWYAAAGDAA